MHTSVQDKPFKLNLSDISLRQNPPREFSKILEQGPVIYGKMPLMGKAWFATSWEATVQVLRNTEDFVREPKNAGRKNYSWIQWMMPSMFNRLSQNMLTRDAEDHRRLRMLADQAFQRQSIERMSPRMEAITEKHLEQIEQMYASGERSVDFLPAFLRPYSLAVICELLGLPDSDRPKFMQWFSGMSQVSSFVHIFRMLPMMRKTMKYLEGQFEEVRKNPRSGLITSLVEAEADGDRLSKDELLSTAMLLLLAGHETTVHLLSNSFLTLLQFEDANNELMCDWTLANSAIDEILRWASIVHITKPRFVARDMEFHGQSISRGEFMIPILGCANFDPAEFDDPLKFDIHRSPNRHMTFGNGPHVCLGMKLAKAETRFALQQTFERWPELRAGFDLENPDFGKRIGMRTLNSLPLKRS